ncbi:MAG: DUF1015 domain-containing protein [Lacipirellulaceae bacterium]
MPDIEAFRGVRYDLGHVGGLSSVVAPPYDVIDAELRARLEAASPHNVVRLILPQDEPGDATGETRYAAAARTYRSWRRDRVLFDEGEAAIYAYHQVYEDRGQSYTRRGFMCRVRLERFGEGNIYPHEETHGGAKADRLKLWRACKANLSQIFGLYPDDTNEAQSVLEAAIAGVAPLEATDHLGVVNRIWPIIDVATAAALQKAMGGRPLYIADGHHRYETACNLRNEVAAQWLAQHGSPLPSEHPANFVLMMCVSMSDEGMLVLPTHRLFRGLSPMTAGDLGAKLGDCFTLEPAGDGPGAAPSAWELVEIEGEQGTLALYTAADQKWTLCRVTQAGRDRLAQVAPERSADWRSLGVSLLHRLVIDELLGAAEGAAPKYVRAIDEVVHGLKHGDDKGRDLTGQVGSGGRFELAAIVMPASLEDIRRVSNHNERMPAKSTYFYPKLLSGLVINPLE